MASVAALGRPSVVPGSLRLAPFKHASPGLHGLVRRHALQRFALAASTAARQQRIHTTSNRTAPPSESSALDTRSMGNIGAFDNTNTPTTTTTPAAAPASSSAHSSSTTMAPLSVLPLSTVLRTLMTTTISSSRALLPPSLAIMSVLAHSKNPVLNPDRNPVLRHFLKKTFYAQFCAGETAAEVRATVDALKRMGFAGVILGYAREVVLTKAEKEALIKGSSASSSAGSPTMEDAEEQAACVRDEIDPWREGTLETVRLAQPGDFVALKLSGAGKQALAALSNRLPPPPALRAALDAVCALAAARDVPLLFDAEQDAVQAGIDDWTMEYQRRYNSHSNGKNMPGHAIVYGTCQAYLKSAPATLAKQLAAAEREGFTLGVKLVRGAYLGSDPRHIIHDTKAQTDACYDGIAEALIRREWTAALPAPLSSSGQGNAEKVQGKQTFPHVSLVCGSHNLESVRRARAVRDALPADRGAAELAIAQLQGMADEVSCDLLSVRRGDLAAQSAQEKAQEKEAAQPTTQTAAAKEGGGGGGVTRAYKYIVWGSTGECMAYLLRRAYENRDAVQRTREGRDAMWAEVRRRFWGALSGRS